MDSLEPSCKMFKGVGLNFLEGKGPFVNLIAPDFSSVQVVTNGMSEHQQDYTAIFVTQPKLADVVV